MRSLSACFVHRLRRSEGTPIRQETRQAVFPHILAGTLLPQSNKSLLSKAYFLPLDQTKD